MPLIVTISCILGVVVLIVVVVLVFRYKKYKQIYGQHLQVATSDDDEPIIGADEHMLTV